MYDVLLIVHFIGLALGLGTSFAMFTLGIVTADMAPADKAAFMRRAMLLGRNGSIGLLLLIVSGVGLISVVGMEAINAIAGGLFHLKLTLVVLLMGTFGYMQVLIRKAKASDPAAIARMPLVGRLMLVLSLAIVMVAVFAFH